MTRPKLGKPELLLGLLAFLAALAVRIVPFTEEVFQPDAVMPWGCPDVYYHLHRVLVGARSWPHFPEFDLWRNYPDGAYSLWTPLFELVPATFAALSGLPPLAVGVVWPALLGALAVFPLLDLLHRLYGRVAWLGVALFIVLPGSLSFATLGRADHHVGEVLLQLWVYALALRALHALQEAPARTHSGALWFGAVMGLSLWMWRGSIVILLPVFVTGWLAAATARDPELRRRTVRYFGLAFGVAALVSAPYGVLSVARGRDPFAAYFLSMLQPGVLACWALLMPIAGQVGETGLRLRPLLRGTNALALAAALAILAIAWSGVRAGTAFLTRVGDNWAATIQESQPVWNGGLAARFTMEELGLVPVLLALLLVLQLVRLVRRWPPAPVPVFVWLCASVALALACMQVRFAYYAAPVVVAVPGALWHALRERSRAVQLGATALALALFAPAARYWTPIFDGDPRTQMSPAPLDPLLVHLMADIHQYTPPAGDVQRPEVRPEYCVLAPWDLGNFIQVLAQRPVLASSGGPHETAAYRDTVAFAEQITRESDAAEVMARRGCRYAITKRGEAGKPGADQQLFARRLHLGRGSDFAVREGARQAVRDGSGRFRWRFESRDPAGRDPLYEVFELVPGAVLRFPAGRAAQVKTSINGPSRSFVYQRRLQPATGGLVEARVSQPGEYQVLDARGVLVGRVAVSEQVVMRGRTLVFAAEPG